jgi:hypothetical protein
VAKLLNLKGLSLPSRGSSLPNGPWIGDIRQTFAHLVRTAAIFQRARAGLQGSYLKLRGCELEEELLFVESSTRSNGV